MKENKMKLLCIFIQFSLPWAFHPGSADVSPCVSLQVFLAFYFVPLLTIRKLQRKLSLSKRSSECFQKKIESCSDLWHTLNYFIPWSKTALTGVGDCW